MLKEFAIEPECLDDLTKLQIVTSGIGFYKGRLISSIPNRSEWIKRLLDVISASDIKPEMAIKIIEILKNTNNFFPRMRKYDNRETWLQNAIAEHNRIAIDAIISDNNDSKNNVYNISDLIDGVDPWVEGGYCDMNRCEAGFKAQFYRIINCANIIKLVDPFFDVTEERFFKCLKSVVDITSTAVNHKIEIHINHKKSVSVGYGGYDTVWRDIISPLSHSNRKIIVYLWDDYKCYPSMHDRYILTNFGGFSIPRGLDLPDPNDIARVKALNQPQFDKIFYEYENPSSVYRLYSKIEI